MVKGYYVESTLKPRSINYSQPKDKGNKFGYMGAIEQLAKQRLCPQTYQIKDLDGFLPKHIKDASISKSQRVTIFDEIGKKNSKVPGPTIYSPEKQHRIKGNYLIKDVIKGAVSEA